MTTWNDLLAVAFAFATWNVTRCTPASVAGVHADIAAKAAPFQYSTDVMETVSPPSGEKPGGDA
jgi:hypothetical protein